MPADRVEIVVDVIFEETSATSPLVDALYTLYPRSAVPPLDTGAVHETVAFNIPAVALIPVGAFGSIFSVTEFEATEAEPVPAAFVAVTVNV
jgi:hypothetical protein